MESHISRASSDARPARRRWSGDLLLAMGVGVATTLGALFVSAIVVAFAGIPDVAAAEESPSPVSWWLSTVKTHGIARRAEALLPPADLQDPARVRRGLAGYVSMCAMCHGEPGRQLALPGSGLDPRPPEFHRGQSVMLHEPRQVFWAIEHGIRRTGMPAWGAAHTDQEIWDLVAVVEWLPSVQADEYAAARAELAGEHHADGHQGP